MPFLIALKYGKIVINIMLADVYVCSYFVASHPRKVAE